MPPSARPRDRYFRVKAPAAAKTKTVTATATVPRTLEEKKQKENERKRQQKDRKTARESSRTTLTSDSAAAVTISPPHPPGALPDSEHTTESSPPFGPPATGSAEAASPTSSTHVPPPVPPLPQFIIDEFLDLLDASEEALVADTAFGGLLSFAMRFVWNSGWRDGQDAGAELSSRSEIPAEPPATTIPPMDLSSLPASCTDTSLLLTVPTTAPTSRFTLLKPESDRPFGSLQRKLARSRRPRSTLPILPTGITPPVVTRRHPRGISDNKPVTTSPISSLHARRVPHGLDWDRDPLLTDLGRALGALGWIRRAR
jgi:hypothetical protein